MTAATPAQRQAARRKRLKAEHLAEVRGIYAREANHERIKTYAKRLERSTKEK